MARTSKRKKENLEYQNITENKAGKVFRVGIYARLSVDSTEKKNESIESQIEIARKHIESLPNMIIVEVYSDLGTTGTNFDRPDFQRMLQDIRKKKINCVVVKDFSRFARDYIETGNYLERIFPFMGVRFISVTDHYDSENPVDGNGKMKINLKNIVNELYAKDISQRVESSKRAKLENGSYIGGIPAYGYEKHKIQDKYVLFKEKETSTIVQRVYEMYDSGKRISEIIKFLYELKVHRPTEYQKTKHVYCQNGETLKQWSEVTLTAMLTNPIYIGTLIQKGGKVKEPIIIENAHEGIVSKELFYRVNTSFEERKSEKKIFYTKELQEPDIFRDILYCGECGHKLRRICTSKKQSYKQVLRRYVYGCTNIGRIDGDRCDSHYIPMKTIEEIVLQVLKKEYMLSSFRAKDYTSHNNEIAQKKKLQLFQEQKSAEEQMEGISLDLSRTYMEYRQKKISKEQFLNYKEKTEGVRSALEKSILEIQERQNQIDERSERENKIIRALVRCKEGEALNYDLIHTLIKRIDVYADARLEVQFYFQKSELLQEKKGDR
ncbi:DNA invertase Pin-like site-specific DNA recombinase [Faecalimonas umbilicata]|uniref:Recombinase n=1 Tax=Faecalimonas umbilicata TaxID=1912855 RepID=A0A4R3JS67_9FIRM|nr:recombinase family protein [Faecalimonas umbilicata]TCS68836.1 DNA invertase Pin-like site-specific DNA recombinase [Faecalimonas umbilicata]GBU04252.1 recombinase [Faecalimonas umbilicata]